ncbi:MAG: hypothetical protein QNJ90_07850 [Planctomycetota bacterium]|nr:hypothetical protein [Planctomycetota bacterium]
MPQQKYKRKKKLIQPKFQLKIAFACLGIAVMSALVLTVMINQVVLDFSDKGWIDSAKVEAEWMGVVMTKLLIALAVLTPMTLALGVILMHRVAGPIYRFRQFMRSVGRGEHPQECRLRKGDELTDLCDLLNRFTAPIRDGTVDYRIFAESLGEELPVEESPDVSDDAPAKSSKRVAALES